MRVVEYVIIGKLTRTQIGIGHPHKFRHFFIKKPDYFVHIAKKHLRTNTAVVHIYKHRGRNNSRLRIQPQAGGRALQIDGIDRKKQLGKPFLGKANRQCSIAAKPLTRIVRMN